jgi:hypothetical protein
MLICYLVAESDVHCSLQSLYYPRNVPVKIYAQALCHVPKNVEDVRFHLPVQIWALQVFEEL